MKFLCPVSRQLRFSKIELSGNKVELSLKFLLLNYRGSFEANDKRIIFVAVALGQVLHIPCLAVMKAFFPAIFPNLTCSFSRKNPAYFGGHNVSHLEEDS